jgi:hypothetical protein
MRRDFVDNRISLSYLWLHGVSCSKPLRDDMRIYHNSRNEAVIRALSDFGNDHFGGEILCYSQSVSKAVWKNWQAVAD